MVEWPSQLNRTRSYPEWRRETARRSPATGDLCHTVPTPAEKICEIRGAAAEKPLQAPGRFYCNAPRGPADRDSAAAERANSRRRKRRRRGRVRCVAGYRELPVLRGGAWCAAEYDLRAAD